MMRFSSIADAMTRGLKGGAQNLPYPPLEA